MAATPPVTPNAKWTDELHKLFVELCAGEVIKGNKVGTTLNKEGWVAVHTEFVRQKNVPWTMRQFKNHWEAMKPDYQLFKKLKFGESGLGWNENTKTIEASPVWWLHKTQENPKYVKFRDKDLSLYMQYYDTLFGDIVATGQRAKAANTYSAVNLEVGEEFTEVGQSSNYNFGDSSNTYNYIDQSVNAFNPFAKVSYTLEEENEEESAENLFDWQVVCTAATYTLVYYYDTFVHKEPCRTSIRTGSRLIREILEGNDSRCYQDFRMNKVAF
ncbi:hypothetical protein POM88_022167 [Heracleum sosnowskyi]|uniref:Myb/SANT-like domain-containing protein n=1 Tax=Heracleum sosnowskyi TaxID=360622 RepID=A0AAD8IHC1_9APIA|nr:hypothetical protein POM88_022167 [Heracleum sosnowskyi]